MIKQDLPENPVHHPGTGDGPHDGCRKRFDEVYGPDLHNSVAELLAALHPVELARINLDLAVARTQARLAALQAMLTLLPRTATPGAE